MHQRVRRRVEHFRIDPTARVTVELRNAQQEKSGRRGASSRGFTRRIGFFLFLFLWAMQHRQVATRCSHLSVLHRPQKKTEKKAIFTTPVPTTRRGRSTYTRTVTLNVPLPVTPIFTTTPVLHRPRKKSSSLFFCFVFVFTFMWAMQHR